MGSNSLKFDNFKLLEFYTIKHYFNEKMRNFNEFKKQCQFKQKH